MGIKDIGKGAKEKLSKVQSAADSVKNTVMESQVTKNAKNVGKQAITKLENTAGSVVNTVKDNKLSENVKGVFRKKDNAENDSVKTDKYDMISTESAIRIIYLLMAADGMITADELDSFELIAKETDPAFDEHRDEIINECETLLSSAASPEDTYDIIKNGISDVLSSDMPTDSSCINPKLLIWNMLTIAYSDEDYSENERSLVEYIADKFDIDKTEFLELESSLLTLSDLEKELSWIKTTDRPYLQIEAMVNEIQNRKDIIFNSVIELITL